MDKMTNLLVHLAMCPGNYQSTCEICHDCPSCSVQNCKRDLKKKVMQLYRGESLDLESTYNLERRISEVLRNLGVPAHLKGYNYLRTAIAVCVEDESILDSITGRLYPKLARHHDTTSSRIERAIRHAIEVAWDRGDLEVLKQDFGNTVSASKGKPTNSEFLACVAAQLRLEVQRNG